MKVTMVRGVGYLVYLVVLIAICTALATTHLAQAHDDRVAMMDLSLQNGGAVYYGSQRTYQLGRVLEGISTEARS